MTRVRAHCSDCGSEMIEVRKTWSPELKKICWVYPKPLQKARGKWYWEYRFYCRDCRKEWVYNALFRWLEDVPEDSTFVYDEASGILKYRACQQCHVALNEQQVHRKDTTGYAEHPSLSSRTTPTKTPLST